MANVVPNVKRGPSEPIIRETVEPGSPIHTDELRADVSLERVGYEHETVNHGAGT